MDRPNSALLVIDVQNDVVAAAHDREAVINNIDQLVGRAREGGTPVIWVQHDDSDMPAETEGWQIVPELTPAGDETIIRKSLRSSFDNTPLEERLTKLKVGRLIVTGAQTDFCVRWTLHGALDRGYDTVLVADGHTTDQESPASMPSGAQLIAHTNSVWASQSKEEETSVVPAAEVTFSMHQSVTASGS